MGILDKFIPKEIKKPFKKTARAVRKFIPKEIRPALPFLSAAVPFMLPGTGIMSLPFANNPAFQRGLLSSLANIGSQQVMDPEGDINLLSAAMAGLTGAGTTEGFGDTLRDMTTKGQFAGLPGGGGQTMSDALANRGFFTKAADLGLTGASKAADFLSGSREVLGQLGSGEMDVFSKAGAKALGKAAAIPVSQGTGDLAYAVGSKAMRDYEKQVADEEAEIEATTTANDQERANLQMTFMRQGGHSEETIQETLEMNDLGEYYVPPESAANGGIIGLKEGGMLNFGGREMDLRGGGFVPIGKKERADDVPARLSKNEFVMTADAVRAAGGGSVNKGAQRMYDIMNKLEARA